MVKVLSIFFLFTYDSFSKGQPLHSLSQGFVTRLSAFFVQMEVMVNARSSFSFSLSQGQQSFHFLTAILSLFSAILFLMYVMVKTHSYFPSSLDASSYFPPPKSAYFLCALLSRFSLTLFPMQMMVRIHSTFSFSSRCKLIPSKGKPLFTTRRLLHQGLLLFPSRCI